MSPLKLAILVACSSTLITCKQRVENQSNSQLQFDEQQACPDFRGGTDIPDQTFDRVKNALDTATQADDKSGALRPLAAMNATFDRGILPGLYWLINQRIEGRTALHYGDFNATGRGYNDGGQGFRVVFYATNNDSLVTVTES